MTVTVVDRADVSSAFRAAIEHDHKVAALARVLRGGEAVADFPVLGGTVDIESQSPNRTRADITFADDGTLGIIPKTDQDILTPFGNEIQVCRGIEYASGDQELVSVGIIRIDDVDVDDTGSELTIQASGQDRSEFVDDAKFEDPYQVAAGTDALTEILTLVQYALPDVEYDFPAIVVPLPALHAEEGESRWELAQGIAEALGCELYFDGSGRLVLQPVPSPQSVSADVTYSEGEDSLLLRVNKKWTRVGRFNRAIVTGENVGLAGTVPRGIATDTDPNSPTYYYGDFGQVPYFQSSEFIQTDDQAEDMAQGLLNRQLGAAMVIDFNVVDDPTLTASMGIRVQRERIGVDETHLIDSISMNLVPDEGGFTGTTRSAVTT